jgi:hypothetical protein
LAVVVALSVLGLAWLLAGASYARAQQGRLTGDVPRNGGIGIAVWGGGSTSLLATEAAAGGCGLAAVWVTRSGEFIGFVYGAPAVVNAAFVGLFPGTSLPANTPVVLVCSAVAPLPRPTGTSAPAPQAITLTFTRADNGSRSTSGEHTGFLGIVFAAAEAGYDPASRRLQVVSAIPNPGVGERPSATAILWNEFTVQGTAGQLTDVQFQGSARWDGTLSGNGFVGTFAGIEVQLAVIDTTNSSIVGSRTLLSRELQESALTLGGVDVVGTGSADFTLRLRGGSRYRFQLTASCEVRSGVIAAQAACAFGPANVVGIALPTGFVDWTSASVTYTDER